MITSSAQVLFIANRGEIALRIARTASRCGFQVVTASIASDHDTAFVNAGDRDINLSHLFSVLNGLDKPHLSETSLYLDSHLLIEAALRVGATHVHPGYGFLSEQADFAEQVINAGMIWVGPPPEAMRQLGDKSSARLLAQALNIPVVPGHELSGLSPQEVERVVEEIGTPLLIKAVAGGGGRGMRRVDHLHQINDLVDTARREALSGFGSDALIVERLIETGRHVEVQIFGDQFGAIVHLGERECSVQRRNQKLIEETPADWLDETLRKKLLGAACRIVEAVGYTNAGTVEFLVDSEGNDYLLEVNTRIQVEHGITEERLGVDLIEWQLEVSSGKAIPLTQSELEDRARQRGLHVIEVRVCAETPDQASLPCSGPLHDLRLPNAYRIEHNIGQSVSGHFDSMILKLIEVGQTRDEALERCRRALNTFRIQGLVHNGPLLLTVLNHSRFKADLHTTRWLGDELSSQESELSVLLAAQRQLAEDQLDDFIEVAGIILSEPLKMHSVNEVLSLVPSEGEWSTGDPLERRLSLQSGLMGQEVSPLKNELLTMRRLRDDRWEITRSSRKVSIREIRYDCTQKSLHWRDQFGLKRSLECVLVLHGLEEELCASQRGSEHIYQWLDQRERAEFLGLAPTLITQSQSGHQLRIMNLTRLTQRQKIRLGLAESFSAAHEEELEVVRSPLAGTLTRCHISVGSVCLAGEPLAIIEAMKLEHSVNVSRPVRILEWFADAQTQVKAGQVIARVEVVNLTDE